MTKLIKKSLIVSSLLIAIIAYAGKRKGDYILNITTGNGNMVSFTMNALRNTSFSIYDEKHNLIYGAEPAVNKLEVSKTISLEGYPSGTYFLEVIENGKIVKHEIKVLAKKVKTVRIDESVNESPSFRR